MSKTETDRNLVLCGFMGCGKSTVGRELAVQTGLSVLDMDHYIVEKAGLPVEEIFTRHGEPYFRMLESQACKELAQTGGQIIATGGGALTFPQNAAMLRETGLIILLDVALPVLCARLDRDPTPRPVLQAAQKSGRLEALHAERMRLYRQAADFTVTVPIEQPASEIAAEILHKIRGQLKTDLRGLAKSEKKG